LEGTLSDGSPCLRHECVACCLETEMPLTEADVERIEKLGFERDEFTLKVGGETRLRNRRGRCFFLEEGVCRVYASRPDGCRIYPLIYDVDAHRFIFDSVCPHTAEFKTTKEDKDHLRHLIRKLDREAAKKL
jgi:Fe-S-cluster containining protein